MNDTSGQDGPLHRRPLTPAEQDERIGAGLAERVRAAGPDRFHMAPRTVTAMAHQLALKNAATELARLIDGGPQGREAALAMTNLEQAVMWAMKAGT